MSAPKNQVAPRTVSLCLDTSLMSLIQPSAQEIGPDLYRMLIAHAASLGTKHDVKIINSAENVEEGFKLWAKSLEDGGAGKLELIELDLEKKIAKIKLTDSWELALQNENLRWGCPFTKGKLIGVFFSIFGVTCWAEEQIRSWEDPYEVEFTVQPSERTIPQAIINLRQGRLAKKTRELQQSVLEKTEQLEKVHRQLKEYSLTLEERIEQRTLELKTANKRIAEAVSQREALLETLCHAILKKIEAVKSNLPDSENSGIKQAFASLAELELPIRTLMEIPKGSKAPLRDTVTMLDIEEPFREVIHHFEKPLKDADIKLEVKIESAGVPINKEKVLLLQQVLGHLINAAKINAVPGWKIFVSISADRASKKLDVKVSLYDADTPNKNSREILLEFQNSDSSVLADFDESLLSLTVANEILARLDSQLMIGTKLGAGIVFIFSANQ